MKFEKCQRYMTCILVVLALVAASLGDDAKQSVQSGFTELAGPLSKTVKAGDGPYLVVADIEVPMGRVVTIEAGTVLLFKNFAGLHVQGRLVAEGTMMRPIVFTSEFDRDYNPKSSLYPNPYDWNGIYIHDNAIGSSLSNCKVMFSVYGIISDTKFIRISPGIFANNGKSNLVIEGEEHFVTGEPYTYSLSLKDATVDGVPVKIIRDPQAPKRNSFRFGGIGAFVAGAGLGVFETIQWMNAQEVVDARSSKSVDNLTKHTDKDWQAAVDKRNKDRIIALASYGVGVLGAVGFAVSFQF